MSKVLVLNATYEPLTVVTVRRAVVLLLKDRAEVLEHDGRELHSESLSISVPVVIRLVLYVKVPRVTHRRVSRKAVIARDKKCQYCGVGSSLTVDHVVPKSRGGTTEWTNVVAACVLCNTRKGDSLPREAGMKLAKTPRIPSAFTFVFIAVPKPPVAWKQYLFR